MNKLFITFAFCISTLSAAEDFSGADCLIIEEENSIICKYSNVRKSYDRNIKIFWINPKENISREKEVLVPAGHGSVYDFRYIEARIKGLWSFKVIDNEKEFSTTFEIK